MSFFGFDTGGGHNSAAPGFSQAHDPFAGLSGRDDIGDNAIDFDDTYDGLGDQLDETDDAFNDDTFGGETVGHGQVGKDFDFFGQTAKVADAIEEEHLRYHRQQPAPRFSISKGQSAGMAATSAPISQYSGHETRRPARTGYEKYQEPEPVPDLHVDQSIWGIGSSKTPVQPATQQQKPPPPPSSRKMMSLEEVEAAMRAQPKRPAPSQSAPQEEHPQIYPSHRQPQQQQQQQQQQPAPDVQQQHHAPVYQGHGHPVTILQRPQSLQSKPQAASDMMQTPASHQFQQVQHHRQHHPPPGQPMQILQNPNRLSGDGERIGLSGHRSSHSQGSLSRMSRIPAPPQMMPMSEDDKTAFLELEAKRAKRNHKIWLLSKNNGLMTPQDKNFITRIQLQQLVTATGNLAEQGGDASISDFYYQVYSHIRAGQRQNPSQPLSNFAQTYLLQTGSRHGAGRRHGRPAENHIQRMEQQVQRAVEAAKNKPKNPQLVIAGSLGKISFSNAKTPKPLLNIKRTTENETQRPNSGRKTPAPEHGIDRKRILQNVEEVYQTLMRIEDHVRYMPRPPAGQPDPELEEKHKEWATALESYNAQLWNELKVHEPIGLTVPHPFIAFLSCAKGKKAIPRIFPHLSFEQRTTILTMIIYHLDQLDVVQGAVVNGETSLNSRMRENIELFISAVMPSLMQYFNDTGLDIVDGVLHLIATKLNVEVIARTRIGVSMLILILSRAVLLKQTGGGNAEQWEKWDQTFEILFNKIEPSLPFIFPGSVNAGMDVHVWQLLAAMGVSATHDQQTRLVLAVKDRVLDTVALSKTLPPAMAAERLGSVNLFMRSIGLDVELLQ